MPAGHQAVRLYRRDGCHLCDTAERDLATIARELGFDVESIDIEADDALHHRYLFEIPVIALGERELLRAPFSSQTLREALTEALADS
ncbi:MAG TPA: glutaredoxin family protein [Tepidiformaceae bacterium]